MAGTFSLSEPTIDPPDTVLKNSLVNNGWKCLWRGHPFLSSQGGRNQPKLTIFVCWLRFGTGHRLQTAMGQGESQHRPVSTRSTDPEHMPRSRRAVHY